MIILVADKPSFTILGPFGSSDLLEFINLETQRPPFKSVLEENDWSDAFRSWPTLIPGWETWYKRVAASKRADWETRDINQCITLSLAKMDRNETLLVVASYFWSDALNAFLLVTDQ